MTHPFTPASTPRPEDADRIAGALAGLGYKPEDYGVDDDGIVMFTVHLRHADAAAAASALVAAGFQVVSEDVESAWVTGDGCLLTLSTVVPIEDTARLVACTALAEDAAGLQTDGYQLIWLADAGAPDDIAEAHRPLQLAWHIMSCAWETWTSTAFGQPLIVPDLPADVPDGAIDVLTRLLLDATNGTYWENHADALVSALDGQDLIAGARVLDAPDSLSTTPTARTITRPPEGASAQQSRSIV